MVQFAAVIFDCDGVLVDSEALALEVELEILADCGLNFEKAEFIRRFMGTADTHFRDLLEAESQARLGRPLRPDFLELVHVARHAAYAGKLGEVPGALSCVTSVRGPKAVASSSRAHLLREKLEMTGLWSLFDPHVYSTQLVGKGKPAPDIFLYTAERLGVAAGECLVIEDSTNGVRAGLDAGMTVWGFVGGGHCDAGLAQRLTDEGAHRVMANWPEIEALLAH